MSDGASADDPPSPAPAFQFSSPVEGADPRTFFGYQWLCLRRWPKDRARARPGPGYLPFLMNGLEETGPDTGATLPAALVHPAFGLFCDEVEAGDGLVEGVDCAAVAFLTKQSALPGRHASADVYRVHIDMALSALFAATPGLHVTEME